MLVYSFPCFMNAVISFQITWVLKAQLGKHYRPKMQVPMDVVGHGMAALQPKYSFIFYVLMCCSELPRQ